MIVNGDMKVFPTRTMSMATAVTVNAVSDTAKTAEFLDIEMKQIAGCGIFIANDGWSRFEIAPTVESKAA